MSESSVKAPGWMIVVPNAISSLRLVIACAFPFVTKDAWLAMVFVAAATDFVDGYIARRFGATSWAGGLLDATADKAFALSVLITLMVEGMISPWAAGALLTRDLVVALIAGYAAARRLWPAFQKMGSRWMGKITTGLLFVLFAVVLIELENTMWRDMLTVLAALSSIAAGADYFAQFIVARSGLHRIQ